MEEQQKKHEAVQELLQKQMEMLKLAISGQPCNVSTSAHIPNISLMFEKPSTNIPSKFVEVAAGKEVCEDGCDDVVEQIEVEANKEKKKKTTKEKLAKSLLQANLETVPKSCKILYGFAQKLMSQGQTLASYIDEDIFGVEKMIYALKEDVISFIQMNEIGQAFTDSMIMVNNYICKLVKDQEWEPKIAFMDPSRTFHDPKSLDEVGRVQHIVKTLNQASIDNIFLIPYNPSGIKQFNAEKGRGLRRPPTWIMLSILLNAECILCIMYGAPKQANGKTCGYCVMRYMKEICEDSSLAFRTK
ncbi:hypothetical protein GBA52_026673, partial [Prunus armeniaca]